MIKPHVRWVVGIDVAKRAHVVCAVTAPEGKLWQKPLTFAATRAGYRELTDLLAQWGPVEQVLIGLEATGCLWEPLYEALTVQGYRVVVLNPRQTAAWATSLGLRAKTDGVDARTLARGLLAGYGRASTLPSETVQALRELTRARADLVHSQTAARQRLLDELVLVFPELPAHTPARCDLADPALLQVLASTGSARALATMALDTLTRLCTQASAGRWGEPEAQALQQLATHSAASRRAVDARGRVVRTFAQHLLDLQARIAELEQAIADLLREDEDAQRLLSMPGIGPQHAATIRAELGDVTRFARVEQVVAYAGLDPRIHHSGTFVGQAKLSKRGPGALRHALYLAVLVAVRVRDEWRTRYQCLLDRGRAKKEALTILSRTYLTVLFHLLRSRTRYDPARLALPSLS